MENILQRINTSAVKLFAPLTLEDAYKVIVSEGVKLVNGDDGAIILKEGRTLRNVFGSSKPAQNSHPRKKGYAYDSIKNRRAFVVQSEELGDIHPEVQAIGIKSSIFIPLFHKNIAIGTLVVRSKKKREFEQKELEGLKVFGSLASLTIRNLHLLSDSKKALQTRDLFLSLASHEFKTPLTAMSGYIQILNKKLKNTEYEKIISPLINENKRLTSLVSELLEINQIEIGKFKFEEKTCSIREIVQQAIEIVSFAHPDRKIIFESVSEEDDNITGDPNKLIQVITNVLNNAAKFSEKNEDILVKITNKKPFITIKIQDKGIGIDKEDIENIFTRFYKGNHSIKEGMGLGLYLSKKIIEHHKGTIHIESQKNIGTSVQITLPQSSK